MSVEEVLKARAGGACELCGASQGLGVLQVGPEADETDAMAVMVCTECSSQINEPATINSDHWRALGETMWSETPAVQVMAWRVLDYLKSEAWAAENLEMLYLDDETLAWAQSGRLASAQDGAAEHADSPHLDCNGTPLAAGDTVTLIKDLNVKGASFTAKRGTAVRRISLVPDNPEHIEGRVNDQQIVILTKFVKKSG